MNEGLEKQFERDQNEWYHIVMAQTESDDGVRRAQEWKYIALRYKN